VSGVPQAHFRGHLTRRKYSVKGQVRTRCCPVGSSTLRFRACSPHRTLLTRTAAGSFPYRHRKQASLRAARLPRVQASMRIQHAWRNSRLRQQLRERMRMARLERDMRFAELRVGCWGGCDGSLTDSQNLGAFLQRPGNTLSSVHPAT
jgi:hypothetical protein